MSKHTKWLAGVVAVIALVLAAMPAGAITGTNPVLVVLCNFSNQTQQPNPPSYYQDMFSDEGAGELGAFDYWRDVSYGTFSVSGTVVTRWYTLPITRDEWVGYVGNDRGKKWQVCAEAAKNDHDYSKYRGVVTVHPNAFGTLASAVSATATSLTLQSTAGAAANFPTPPFKASLAQGNTSEVIKVTAVSGATFTIERGQAGSTAAAFPAGAFIGVGNDLFGFNPTTVVLGGKSYSLGGMVMSHDHPLSLAGHEEGHLFGLNHSRALSQWPGSEYSDCYDLMSTASCAYTFTGAGTAFGGPADTSKPPGLNSIQLDAHGWLPSARTATFDNSSCRQQTYTLAALNHPEKSGLLQLRVPATVAIQAAGNSEYYALELRSKSGWDRGIPADAVVLHLKGSDGYSYLVDRDALNLGVGNLGDGGLRAGRIYIDSTENVYIAVNSIDPADFTGVVTLGGCRINAALTYDGDTSAVYHRQATLAADLKVTGSSAPVPNVSVEFDLGTQSCSDTTDAAGHASCTITVNQPSGPYTVNVGFAGNAAYNPASTNAAFTIERAATTLAYTGPTVILQGAAGVTLSALLLEDGTTPPAPTGRTVVLGVGTETCTAGTDASGVATCTVIAAGTLGDQPITARFDGDEYYLPSSDTGKTAVVFAFPASGAFVLGDSTLAGAAPGTALTWWDSSWTSLNSLTSGAAPKAFKGFTDSVSTLPTATPITACGTTFQTSPAASGAPPREVPSYMGVLVADSVTKSGSTISGTWARIVVVKTDAGYASSPGHAGTGTIVATVCS